MLNRILLLMDDVCSKHISVQSDDQPCTLTAGVESEDFTVYAFKRCVVCECAQYAITCGDRQAGSPPEPVSKALEHAQPEKTRLADVYDLTGLTTRTVFKGAGVRWARLLNFFFHAFLYCLRSFRQPICHIERLGGVLTRLAFFRGALYSAGEHCQMTPEAGALHLQPLPNSTPHVWDPQRHAATPWSPVLATVLTSITVSTNRAPLNGCHHPLAST